MQKQAVRNVDETGWYQHDQDKKSWLWVVVTPMVTAYKIARSRAGKEAKELIGDQGPVRNGHGPFIGDIFCGQVKDFSNSFRG